MKESLKNTIEILKNPASFNITVVIEALQDIKEYNFKQSSRELVH